ncbi:histidine--tRNA ligase [Clostridium sp. 'deep sea']|uniref:histidine--tRNA ligase n=1 Tax=Clostridium sp. 'deep sea' TaxID=2779445 RepID=UPI0018967B0F|nr:histidine--tRNA ligase [Clostridium sp. 'deep sea']QOR34130.1 histidine--tRNA ligase [Clostridium sp. 'deep sea']
MLTKAPRGTYDALPGIVERYQYIENVFKNVAESFGYKEIRTPVFEHTELFKRGVGETTDVVQKEMYTFEDRGGRSLTLRAEGTAPVVRAFVEKKLYNQALPARFFYNGVPIFRYERPQAGRLRQHHQLGVELFGINNPKIDVEVIDLLYTFYKELGMNQLVIDINSIGCVKCRKEHRKALVSFLEKIKDQLCETCQARLTRNPMRILDCKNENCQYLTLNAPVTSDYLCDECKNHYSQVKQGLISVGVEYNENKRLVRGLDYYTNTAFEIKNTALKGAINVIGGGGRYNGLVKNLGGPSIPSIGFGSGLERIDLACEAEGIKFPTKNYCDIYIVRADDYAGDLVFKLLHDLRKQGIKSDMDYANRSLKSQMKQASKLNSKIALIIGEDEVKLNKITLKNLKSGEQSKICRTDIVQKIRNIIG